MTNFNWNMWLDKDNLIHIHENPELDQSENGLTFTGSLHVLWKACGMKSELPKIDLSKFIVEGSDGKPLFLPTSESALNSHFSLDNNFGTYVMRELYSPELELPTSKWYKPKEGDSLVIKKLKKRQLWDKIPKFGQNLLLKIFPYKTVEKKSYYWLRPDTLAYNALLNKLPFATFYAPIILKFGANLTCAKPKDHTSGKRLLFDRYLLLSLSKDEKLAKIGKEGLELMDELLKPIHGENPMIDVIDFYFKNPNHPLRKLIRIYYDQR